MKMSSSRMWQDAKLYFRKSNKDDEDQDGEDWKDEDYQFMGAAFEVYNYMRIARQPVGYLVTFGHKGTLEWKRLILSELIH